MLFKFWTVVKCLSVHWGVLCSSKAVSVVYVVSLPFFKLLNKLTNLVPLAQLSFRYIHLYSFKRSISFWGYLSANCVTEILKVLGFLSIRTFISCNVWFFTFVHPLEKVPSCLCTLCENFHVIRRSFFHSRRVKEPVREVLFKNFPSFFFFPAVNKRKMWCTASYWCTWVWLFGFNVCNFIFDYWNAHSLFPQHIKGCTFYIHDLCSSLLNVTSALHTFSVIVWLFLQLTDSFIKWHEAREASQQDFHLKKQMYLHSNAL